MGLPFWLNRPRGYRRWRCEFSCGAAFTEPIGIELKNGRVKPGPWSDYALPTYSGLGVYTQTLTLSAADLSAPLTLDLGQVLVAAEVS